MVQGLTMTWIQDKYASSIVFTEAKFCNAFMLLFLGIQVLHLYELALVFFYQDSGHLVLARVRQPDDNNSDGVVFVVQLLHGEYIRLSQLENQTKYCMSSKQIAQKVIDFQYSRINAPFEVQKQPPQDYDKYHDRYSKWNLTSIIRDLQLPQDHFNLYWVGYGDHTLIEAFIYCLLTGFKVNNEVDNTKFAKTKYSLYQICQKYLTLAEQKQLVENLCYSQYTKNMANYLNKNCVLEELIDKIYRSHTQSFNQVLLPLEELKLFALNFTFLTFQILNDSVALINNFSQKYYIIIEKQCVFVIDFQGDKATMKSSIRSNQRNSVTHGVYIQNLQCSTPKFVPNKDYSYKQSSSKAPHKAVSDREIVEVATFDREDEFLRPEKYHYHHQNTKKKLNSHKKQVNGVKKYKSTSPNMSLRHTLDMHIANLQKYEKRQKSNRKPKTGFFRESSKDKDREKIKITSNDSFTSILKSKSSERRHLSPSPELNSSYNNSVLALKKSSCNHIYPPRQSKINLETSFLKNRGTGTQTKICFTYYSP